MHLQTMFLTTNVKGTDREMYLPVNVDIDPLPHLDRRKFRLPFSTIRRWCEWRTAR